MLQSKHQTYTYFVGVHGIVLNRGAEPSLLPRQTISLLKTCRAAPTEIRLLPTPGTSHTLFSAITRACGWGQDVDLGFPVCYLGLGVPWESQCYDAKCRLGGIALYQKA